MKITKVETARVDVPLPGEGLRPAWGPGLVQRAWSNVLVKIHTDEGITGCAAGPSFVQHIDERIAPYMVGKDPFALEYHHQVLLNALEYLHDPPLAPFATFSALVVEPLKIDKEGYVRVPDKPGLGVELNEETVARYGKRG